MDQSVGCSTYSGSVYKCNIMTTGAIAATSCTDSGQLQIGTIPNQNGVAPGLGLGAMAGAVYANYVYLIGGLTPNVTDLKTVRYAKFDNNNNVVAASGSSWTEGPNQTTTGRRRGAGFGYNGYLYVVGGYDGTGGGGVLDDIEFAKINVSDGSWGSFTNSSVTINQRWGLTVPVSNSYAYVIGGCTIGTPPASCTTRTSTTQTFQIYNNDSGAPSGFTTSANTYGTNASRIGAASAILNGYLYVAGGCTTMNTSGVCTAAVSTVSYSAIDANGSLGTWSNTTGSFPGSAVRAFGKLEAAGGTLYYIGGQSSTETDVRSEVFYGTPASGDVSTWGTASNGLPAVRTKFGAAVWNNRIYVVGGLNGSGTATNTVYVSPQLNSGGDIGTAWSTSSTSLSVARYGAMVVAYANNLYVFGGNDGTNYLSDGQYAQISTSTGNSGSWTYTTSLPTPLAQGEAFAVNGYMYIVGGRSAATTCKPITLVAPISANTTIASGNNPTGVGEWYQTNQKYTGDRYGNTANYYNGKVFVTGGGCGSTLSYASPVTQQSALLSQPQVAQYSIMFDTDDDVYPQKWLLNGLDNSVGAFWQLNYRSMSTTANCAGSAMTTFGQNTTVNPVTLGTPGTYTVYDGSGTNIHCSRYFYLAISIDSSQAYGYPEDVSRGPTIGDLTFEFQARAGNRLMHGQGFTGGLKQPDDTPF
ncbi:MAG: Kelch repeat-containing protein, partial [Candidatus Saccharimonadales bacterium]